VKGTEFGDLPVYLENVVVDQVIHAAAWLVRVILKAEQGLHFVQRHSQGAAAPDEVQALDMGRTVHSIICLGPEWRG
jgi:hypothetical protein